MTENTLLGSRKTKIDSDGLKLIFKLTRGTDQGGVLSPVIWNIVFNQLLNQINKKTAFACSSVQMEGFADDGAMSVIGIDLPTITAQMQVALKEAEHWAERAGVAFSPQKTEAIIFHGKRTKPIGKKLTLCGVEIKYKTKVKYLGIILDEKLSWKEHIKHKVQTCKGILMRTKAALSHYWGPSPEMSKWLYTGIIRPTFTYGAVVWGSGTFSKDLIKSLEKLHRLALMQITPVRKSTPTAGLEIIYGLEPIDLHVKNVAVNTAMRLQPQWGKALFGIKGHRDNL